MKASILAPLAVVALFAAVAAGQDATKSPNLEDGLKAARKSGKPLLVITSWKPGV